MIGEPFQSASLAGLPPMAVPMTVKMPEPMTMPMPSAVAKPAEGLMERVLRQLRVGDQLVDGLGGEDLPGQRRAPVGESFEYGRANGFRR